MVSPALFLFLSKTLTNEIQPDIMNLEKHKGATIYVSKKNKLCEDIC